MPRVIQPNQLRLFTEVIDTETTRDHVTDDAVLIQPPPGRGWFVLSAHRERFTQWQRRRPVVRLWKRSRTC